MVHVGNVLWLLGTYLYSFLYTANPITTPAMEKTKCMVKSTNVQFRYETKQELECQLWHDYGNVS